MGGKGTWGIGGTVVNLAQLQQLSTLSIIPDDITLDEKSKVISLNNITQGQFLTTANATIRDFTDTSKLHYLSYSLDDVLHVKRFIGQPGEYGGEGDLLSDSDFEDITNSNVKPIAVVPTLEEIISRDNIITSPITTADNNTGSKIEYKGSGIEYESLDGFKTKIGYESNTKNVEFKIPAKETDDVFAMQSDIDGLTLAANQSISEIYLKNNIGDTLATLNVGFLNNEGTTFVYNPVTEKLELRNDQNILLSEVPIGDFVSNMLSSGEFNATTPSKLDFKDSEGNVVFSVSYTINNVLGLQTVLENKISLGGDNFPGNMIIGSTNTSPFTLMAQGVQLLKMYGDRINILGSTKIEHPNSQVFSMTIGQNNVPATINRMTSGNTRVLEIFNNHAESTGDVIGFGSANIVLAGVTKNGNMWGVNATQNNEYATLGQVLSNIPENYIRPAVDTPIEKYNVWAGTKTQYETLIEYREDCIYLISESSNPYFINNITLTTNQTAASLNTLYPEAVVGFTVSCPNIPMVYTKTTYAGQWMAQNISVLNI